MLYFNKALKTYIKRKDDKIFIASMHNNFGMCFNQLNKTDKAIQETLEGIEILESKKKLNKEDLLFITAMKVNLGKYYLKQDDYKNSYTFWNEGFEFYRKIEQYNSDFMFVSQKLFDMYEKAGQNDKRDRLARFLIEIDPKIQYLPDKITLYEMLQNYYLEINDREKQKTFSKKILHLITLYNEKNQKELAQVSDLLNDYLIKSINQKYDYEVNIQKKNNWLVLVSSLLVITVLAVSFINVRKKNKKNKELAKKQELTLNQDIQSQKNRIKNLQLSLNLKIEMEKAFLENLKQIKKTKNLNAEEVVKNLIFKINNLLEIDRKNNDIINESYTENKMFMEKLSERFPVLTDQELQLCIYFKLDLSSKEISLLENIKDVTARVYKANIKSKMKLEKETDLTLFLNTIR
ncbi:hypothetical protein ACKW6Q_14440 [Chryseobacterium kwangjuense]|uniref:HTH luxR-type domain-containing protein n=1 Tax=Chryseobacterium kwangjuense TaxID=267125 RepID=A0ABW9K661_9FLAO